VFFFLAVLITAALFVLGNFQEFLDTSQLLLLQFLSAGGVLCAASGVWYLFSITIWMIRRRHLMLLRLVLTVISTSIGAGAVVVATALQALTQGV
jgi:hypothetical protein